MDIPDRKRILITVCNGDVIFFDLTSCLSTKTEVFVEQLNRLQK